MYKIIFIHQGTKIKPAKIKIIPTRAAQAPKNSRSFSIGKKRKKKRPLRIVELCWKIVLAPQDCMMIIIQGEQVGIEHSNMYERVDRFFSFIY